MENSEKKLVLPPGLHFDISFEDYVGIDAVNNSTLKILTDQSPAHARYYMENGRPETKALAFGSAADCFILEPSLFAKQYVVGPDLNRNTIAWKEYKASVPEGMEILKQKEMDDIISIYNTLSKSPAMCLLKGGRSQVVIIWEDESTGLLCKARLDYLNEEQAVMTDLKTTKDANPENFAKDIFKYKYFQQGAFYMDGYKKVTGADFDPPFFFFACEKTPPFVHSAMQLGDKSVEAGRMCYRKAIKRFAKCIEENHWPMYTEEIGVIEMPNWALVASGYGEDQQR